MEYWVQRAATAQDKLTTKSIKEVEAQLGKYYASTMQKILGQFELTYNKVFSSIEDGITPTPADLYKLDTYWQMQGQLKKELQKLGDKQAALLSDRFVKQFINVYEELALNDGRHFNRVNRELAEQMINQIWCADGKSWSSRIWTNTDKLQQALNDNLIECLVAGKSTNDLRQLLQDDFGVSYNNADSIVRTEMSHIQNQAARKRYEDIGAKEIEVWASEDERRCDICGKLHEKRFPIGAAVPIPAHPRCRCCILPVIEEKKATDENEAIKNKFGQEVDIDEKLKTDKWKNSISMFRKLSNEYETRLTSIKPNAANLAGSANMGGLVKLSSPKVDTAIHEFAHTINLKSLADYKVENTEDFWKEIKAIRRRYKRDVGEDSSRWISSYANENLDEFMAEAFTHAKLKELDLEIPFQYGNDFTYSNEVLEAVNKYFKKKKKKK